MTDNTMREGKLWAFLHDSIHEAYKKLSTTGTSNEYHALLDSIAANVADDVDARFMQVAQSEQSVAVLGPPVAWVNINKHGDITRTVRRRDNWCTTPVFVKPTTSIPAAELATLREKAAQLEQVEKERDEANARLHDVSVACATAEQERDELRKDAERYRWLRDGNDNKKSAACHIAVNCYGLEWDDAIDAAIAQEGE